MVNMRPRLLNGAKLLTSAKAQSTIIHLCREGLEPFEKQKAWIKNIDSWSEGKQLEITDTNRFNVAEGSPFKPRNSEGDEIGDLETRSPDPWAKLIVSSLAQTIYWDGAKVEGTISNEPMDAWQVLEENQWENRQIAVTRATIGHGLSFVKVLPAISALDGSKSASVRGVSGKRMAAFYDEIDSEWPTYAIEVDDQPETFDGETTTYVRFYDDTAVHHLRYKGNGRELKDWYYYGPEIIHDLGVCPIVKKANLEDLDGQVMGEIEPVVPLLRRLDQDTFDRLVVQRFGAWKVRYATGMVKPESVDDQKAQALQLRIMDMLISANDKTTFGTLDGTDTKGYIEAKDADLRVLAAVTQTPPHHLLGVSANLQAEALAAAEAGLQRKSLDYRIGDRSSNIMILRLIAKIRGNAEEAKARKIKITHRDTESRSFYQTVQALGVMASQLGIPQEMLWEKLPDWGDEDTNRAKDLIEQGVIDQLLQQAVQAQAGAAPANVPGAVAPGKQAGGGQQEPTSAK